MKQLRVGTAKANRGQIAFGSFTVGYLSDSTPVDVPVIIIHGGSEGPFLMLSAAVHGPEITGTEVIRRICREIIDPQTLKGSIIALPIANPYAYRTTSWFNRDDGYNLNRAYPGNENGWTSFRLAHAIFENVVKKVDAIIDLHCMNEPAILYTHIYNDPNSPKMYSRCREMADAFGLGVMEQEVNRMAHRAGSLMEVATEINIPGIFPELQYWRRIDPVSVNVGVRGTLNVMKLLGMLEGNIEAQDKNINALHGIFGWCEIFSNRGGLVEFVAQPGDKVKVGQIVVRIRNPYGDVLEEVTSPTNGILVGFPIAQNQAVRTGELMVFIASLKEE